MVSGMHAAVRLLDIKLAAILYHRARVSPTLGDGYTDSRNGRKFSGADDGRHGALILTQISMKPTGSNSMYGCDHHVEVLNFDRSKIIPYLICLCITAILRYNLLYN